MPRQRKIVFGCGLSLLCAVGFWVWNWTPAFDLANVDKEILELKRPLLQVSVEHFLDGGSVGLTLTDASGKTLLCAFPIDNESVPPNWPIVIVGSTWVGGGRLQDTSRLREVDNHQDTKAYLLKLVDEDSSESDQRVLMLAKMRGAPRDRIRLLVRSHLR